MTFQVTYIDRTGSIEHEIVEAAGLDEAVAAAKRAHDDVMHVRRIHHQTKGESRPRKGKSNIPQTLSMILFVLVLVGIGLLVRLSAR